MFFLLWKVAPKQALKSLFITAYKKKNCYDENIYGELKVASDIPLQTVYIVPGKHAPGPNFIELLKHKILLKQTIHCLVKSDLFRPRLHSIVMLSKQRLNTSHKQCIWHEILASNMCKMSELFSCLRKLFA